MQKIKNILRKFFLILGFISFIILIVSLVLFYFDYRSNSISYDKMNLDDGPYIFWINDTTIKIVDIKFISQKRDFNIIETNLNLHDTTFVLEKIKNELKIEFNPYQKHKPDTSIFIADKICAVSDIHGCYNYFVSRLKNNQIIDDSLNWNWDNGHLVIVGDVLDKGCNVTECLWLIKKLEKQAKNTGGNVHYLLGNHEISNLIGKRQHIHKKYEMILKKLDMEYVQLFGKDTEFGRWLRTKNGVIKINDILFSHACISTDMKKSQLKINDINYYTRKLVNLNHYFSTDTYERKILKLLNGYWGPYCCDEYFFLKHIKWEYEDGRNILNNALSYYDCNRIIMGHQHVKEIKPLYNNKVVLVSVSVPDVPSDDILEEDSDHQMLLIEEDKMYVMHFNGTKEKLVDND